MKPSLIGAIVVAIVPVLTIEPVQALAFTNQQFLSGSTAGTEVLNLASPGQVLSGSTPYQYNTINDATGSKLTISNGDSNDFTLSGSSTTGALGTTRAVLGSIGASSPLSSVESARIGAQHSYTKPVSSNNPGSVESNSFRLIFNSTIMVTDATFNFSSLNTQGITWEYSVLQFLDFSGNPFSPLSGPSWTIGSASQYLLAGSGFSGQAGIGNFIAASTGTVTNVGTAQSAEGANGPRDNISALNYALVGLTPGTQIGGITWTTYLEDVRGTNNVASNFTSALLDFSISGRTVEAVPTPALLPGLMATGLSVWRRRQKLV
jgi:hypothetical protein